MGLGEGKMDGAMSTSEAMFNHCKIYNTESAQHPNIALEKGTQFSFSSTPRFFNYVRV